MTLSALDNDPSEGNLFITHLLADSAKLADLYQLTEGDVTDINVSFPEPSSSSSSVGNSTYSYSLSVLSNSITASASLNCMGLMNFTLSSGGNTLFSTLQNNTCPLPSQLSPLYTPSSSSSSYSSSLLRMLCLSEVCSSHNNSLYLTRYYNVTMAESSSDSDDNVKLFSSFYIGIIVGVLAGICALTGVLYFIISTQTGAGFYLPGLQAHPNAIGPEEEDLFGISADHIAPMPIDQLEPPRETKSSYLSSLFGRDISSGDK